MEKLDLLKHDKPYYSAKPEPVMVHLKPAHYIGITGMGDPSGHLFQQHIETLYPVVYGVKFASKTAGKDFVVAKLEGLWWYDEERFKNLGGEDAPVKVPREAWCYRLMIRMPEWINRGSVERAKQDLTVKKPGLDSSGIEYFELDEGACVQCLHAGPYEQEPFTLKRMHDFMINRDLQRNGLHHEVYLSDFRKTAPEKLKTILRQPVR